jgi:NAD(P)-dependent dehydrogenase (short-subunit alcohol dehydrogenase family)
VLRLDGKVAVVTGCGTAEPGWGNGKTISVLFARQGATIAGVDRDLAAALQTRRIIREEGGACEVDACDVTDAEAVAACVERVLERFGRIDVLVNNVGRSAPGGPVELAPEAWDEQIAVNLRSTYLLCHEVLPVMERAGGGAIVNISSAAGLRWIGKPQVGYAAAKAALQVAVRGLTERRLERADEVRLGHVRDPRERRDVEWLGVRPVHRVPRTEQQPVALLRREAHGVLATSPPSTTISVAVM